MIGWSVTVYLIPGFPGFGAAAGYTSGLGAGFSFMGLATASIRQCVMAWAETPEVLRHHHPKVYKQFCRMARNNGILKKVLKKPTVRVADEGDDHDFEQFESFPEFASQNDTEMDLQAPDDLE